MLKIAHRGDWRSAPENSMLAFQNAIQNAADAIELDVRLCQSGEIVVIHDTNLKRLFGEKISVHKSNFSELRKTAFLGYKNEFLPRLEEVFESFGKDVLFNIEIKNFELTNKRIVSKLMTLIQDYKMEERVWISSFNPLILRYCKNEKAEIKLAFLFDKVRYIPLLFTEYYDIDAWHPHYSIVNEDYIAVAKKRKKEVYVWTVNDPIEFERLKKLEVNGIITDNLDLF